MGRRDGRERFYYSLIVILFASSIYLISILSPPSLMDDVDAVQAQIAANMLESGDWVTARLDGVKYLEKSPLKYWLMAGSFAVFGVHDWAARIPIALAIVLLCWVTARFGAWAFTEDVGLWAGLSLATCIGLFLFTRILIPDVILTLTITVAMWGYLRALDPHERRPALWAWAMWASIGTGLLLKGLIAAVFPVAAAVLHLYFTREMFNRAAWRNLRLGSGMLIAAAIALPWHVAATIANPPYFDFTMRSVPGEYHGFFWFYFFNEHVFRFLNMRHPRDYNTVPRVWFWLFHLLWLFPWSAYLPRIYGMKFIGEDRATRTRLLCLCWTGFLLAFFTFSTTQEYYSMPCYPALALLLGGVLALRPPEWPARIVSVISAAAALAVVVILAQVWNLPAPGDISNALRVQETNAYTLSLGHMGDLTLASFAYLRLPLMMAGVAFVIGAAGGWMRGTRKYFLFAVMMVLFLNAARVAMITFDPYLASRPLAEAWKKAPPGQVIVDNQYYTFSSVFFYGQVKNALLLNGRVNNLEYGSYAPDAPRVFIDDAEFARRWTMAERHYLFVEGPAVDRLAKIVGGRDKLMEVAAAGGKYLFTNLPR